ncbi:hypothetical protein M9H77_31106 [Catharanthus roseus]|uniref:Uncharacterized protein n=1 Tax=Catharanthus roseus TaxID=4058 RepID=A0ACB9ZZH1_CATRO|nr:hypothetical protein M9H77_31106 [Catharanthus roseus]
MADIRGHFARLCIELDLTKSFVPMLTLMGFAQATEYEGLQIYASIVANMDTDLIIVLLRFRWLFLMLTNYVRRCCPCADWQTECAHYTQLGSVDNMQSTGVNSTPGNTPHAEPHSYQSKGKTYMTSKIRSLLSQSQLSSAQSMGKKVAPQKQAQALPKKRPKFALHLTVPDPLPLAQATTSVPLSCGSAYSRPWRRPLASGRGTCARNSTLELH